MISSSSPPQTSINFTESAATVTVGQPVTFDVHINVLDQNGQVTNGVAAGLVDFSAGSAGGSGQFHFATLQLDGTGSLTFTYQGFVPGDYIVTASYLGSPASSPIAGQLELHVLAPQSTATTTTVSATPSSFPSGNATSFSATVTEAGGAPVPAGGNVAFSAGPNATSLTSEGEAQTDANGVAQLSVQNFLPGSYVVVAQVSRRQREQHRVLHLGRRAVLREHIGRDRHCRRPGLVHGRHERGVRLDRDALGPSPGRRRRRDRRQDDHADGRARRAAPGPPTPQGNASCQIAVGTGCRPVRRHGVLHRRRQLGASDRLRPLHRVRRPEQPPLHG